MLKKFAFSFFLSIILFGGFLFVFTGSIPFFTSNWIEFAKAEATSSASSTDNKNLLIEGQLKYNNDEVQKQTDAFTGKQGANFGKVKDPREAVAGIISAFLVLLGILFLVYAIYAGYLILTSAGNEERIEKGKSILLNTTIGLAIILSAYGATWIVRSLFVASGNEAYKDCYPPEYEEFINDPLSPHNDTYKKC